LGNLNHRQLKIKGKVHPTTSYEDPEADEKYSYTISLASALDGCGWSTPCPGRFTPEKRLSVRHLKKKKYTYHSTTNFIDLKTRSNNRKEDTNL
jgi:hypothetical protein